MLKHFEQSCSFSVHFVSKPDVKQTRQINFMQLSNFPTLFEQIQTLSVFCATLLALNCGWKKLKLWMRKTVCLFTCRCINLASSSLHICEHGTEQWMFFFKSCTVQCGRIFQLNQVSLLALSKSKRKKNFMKNCQTNSTQRKVLRSEALELAFAFKEQTFQFVKM